MPALDAIVVGGGHNGLVAAAYLARAGKRVLLLERREQLGGAVASERLFSGHDARLSRWSYLVSLLPDRIVSDLELDVELRTRPIAGYAPTVVDGRPTGLLLEDDAHSEATAASFREVTGSDRDHEALLEFGRMLEGATRRLFATFTERLPTRDAARALMGREAWRDLVERPLADTLVERFDHPLVRGAIATDGLIGTFSSLDDPGLAQNRCFLYHVAAGPWRVPVGGMGAISDALENAVRAAGTEVRTGAEVLAVSPSGEVTWRDAGGPHAASAERVLAAVPASLLCHLLGEPAPPHAPQGAQLKVNMLLDRLPAFRSGIDPRIGFAGTLRVNEDAHELEAAYAAAVKSELPERPPAELYCHTLTDPSIARGGPPTLAVLGRPPPPRLFAADEAGARDALVERYLDALDEHLAEPIRECLARDAEGRPCLEAQTPQDLERELGLPAGDIFHGPLAWPWLAEDDAPTGPWGAGTGHERILLAGASARRGGGVSGIGGHNAAMAALGR